MMYFVSFYYIVYQVGVEPGGALLLFFYLFCYRRVYYYYNLKDNLSHFDTLVYLYVEELGSYLQELYD